MLGWEWRDVNADDEWSHSAALVDEREINVHLTADNLHLPKSDDRSMWMHTFWVDDVEDAHAKALECGGTSLLTPTDNPPEGGKVALVLNRDGAPLVLWDGREGAVDFAFGDLSSPCWTEYYTRDVIAANRFMQDVFGSFYQRVDLMRPPTDWEPTEGEVEYEYHWLKVPGLEPDRGGMIEMDESWGDMAPHFMVYFRVEDCGATAGQASELGGEVHVQPVDIPPGQFAVIGDPLGSVFSVMSMHASSGE